MMRAAVEIAAGKIPLEASGNVTLDTVAADRRPPASTSFPSAR